VLQVGLAARPTRIVVVVGVGADQVRAEVSSWKLRPRPVFVDQPDQLGTGDAVRVAERPVGRARDVLVMGGDFDPVDAADVRKLMARHRRTRAAGTIASTELKDPGGYGRVVREGSRLVEIVEDPDASPAERALREVSILLMAFRREALYEALPLLDRNNRQREYYLNRVIPILLDKGERIDVVPVDTGGAMGLNSRSGLAEVTRVVRERINAKHMAAGVTLVDPATTYIDVEVRIGADTVVYPNTYLEGSTRIGRNCTVGPSAAIASSQVGDDSTVWFSVVEGTKIAGGCEVGPFARVRPGTILERGAKVGTHVEVKASRIGRESKVPHLSYVGDADIGAEVNIGAATVTVNYDGYEKHRTQVGDGARIGSDTMLVAPIKIGKGAVTGAGSVITKDVPAGALAVERSEQRTVPGYRRRKDHERGGR
jgi:bifunctional UDP-N-acetylglucosamine pyrophosphorylase/glucosamine-1-phosphate N-acetyltransferase